MRASEWFLYFSSSRRKDKLRSAKNESVMHHDAAGSDDAQSGRVVFRLDEATIKKRLAELTSDERRMEEITRIGQKITDELFFPQPGENATDALNLRGVFRANQPLSEAERRNTTDFRINTFANRLRRKFRKKG